MWGVKGVYVLKMKNDKYYIGQSKNIGNRLFSHLVYSQGIVKRYGYRKYIKHIEYNKNTKEREDLENKLTLEYIDKYGNKNVYGGVFVNTKSTLKYINNFKKNLNKDLIEFAVEFKMT